MAMRKSGDINQTSAHLIENLERERLTQNHLTC